jgi:hypothetical protein
MILLSSHTDVVTPRLNLSYNGGNHYGLLDNFIGILTTYLTLYSSPAIRLLEKESKISIYHNTMEEFGILHNAPKLFEGDIVINIDVCSNNEYDNYDIAIENIYGIENINSVIENLEWEGYKILKKEYTGDLEDEDEAFEWIKKQQPVLSFIIPIQSRGNGWHKENSIISNEVVLKASECLSRLICYLL